VKRICDGTDVDAGGARRARGSGRLVKRGGRPVTSRGGGSATTRGRGRGARGR